MNLKIGIVTVQDSSNLGSFLQALSLQEVVKKNGDEPIFVKTRSKFSTLCLFLGYNNSPSVRSTKSFIAFVLNSIKHLRTTKAAYQKYKTYKKDWNQYNKVITVKKFNRMNADVLLLGSDEIWNTNKPVFRNSIFYGVGVNAKRKYGYAVSVGDMKENGYDKFPELQGGIADLDGVLVRDNHSYDVLSHYDINCIGKICDPTLQIDIKEYMKNANKVELPDKDYMVVYAYTVSNSNRHLIQEFAKANNLITVAVSLPHSWCDKYVNCSPLEFGAILENAKYVFTATFHGTIFSALYHTNFLVQASLPKVFDVLEILGLEKNIIPNNCDTTQFENLMKQSRNYEDVEYRIKNLRDKSDRFYHECIKQERINDGDLL